MNLTRFAPLALALALPAPAFAVLGDSADSVARDRESFQAQLTVKAAAKYQVHELKLPSGGLVREFVAPGGTVFAVSWKGPRAPDLRQLLGASFPRYTAAVKSRRNSRHLASLQSDDLQISSLRFQRGFQGQAVLTALVPEGVTNVELR